MTLPVIPLIDAHCTTFIQMLTQIIKQGFKLHMELFKLEMTQTSKKINFSETKIQTKNLTLFKKLKF